MWKPPSVGNRRRSLWDRFAAPAAPSLALIYKSLEAVKTLGALPQDELLDDTIEVVDRALNEAA